jgi:hypothetical protein
MRFLRAAFHEEVVCAGIKIRGLCGGTPRGWTFQTCSAAVEGSLAMTWLRAWFSEGVYTGETIREEYGSAEKNKESDKKVRAVWKRGKGWELGGVSMLSTFHPT